MDCEDFITHADFFIALLKSIESGISAIGVSRSIATKDKDNADEILDCIEEILPAIKKHWLFVFDQVNRIFDEGLPTADGKDVGASTPPLSLMKNLNKRKGWPLGWEEYPLLTHPLPSSNKKKLKRKG